LAAILVDISKHVRISTSIRHEHFFEMAIIRYGMVVSFKIFQEMVKYLSSFAVIVETIINFEVSMKMALNGRL
jgi:hypothetical protein